MRFSTPLVVFCAALGAFAAPILVNSRRDTNQIQAHSPHAISANSQGSYHVMKGGVSAPVHAGSYLIHAHPTTHRNREALESETPESSKKEERLSRRGPSGSSEKKDKNTKDKNTKGAANIPAMAAGIVAGSPSMSGGRAIADAMAGLQGASRAASEAAKALKGKPSGSRPSSRG